ncbi:MAG: hypothetical protein ACR2J8_13375, partial [Thermomicrobiales bacterium]
MAGDEGQGQPAGHGGGAVVVDCALSPVVMDPRFGPVRLPRKSPVGRGPRYERQLDRTTLLYDLFREENGETALAAGPALPRHFPGGEGIRIICAECGQDCEREWRPGPNVHGDLFRIALHPHTSGVLVAFGGQVAARAVQPNLSGLLAGRRVLLSRAMNDDLTWLADRAWFHAFHHGFDAVIHYDNGSTAYTREDVARALQAVPGIETALVVDWPFNMWPRAAQDWPDYDEVWGENAIINHALHRFLRQAECVFWGDTDELLIQRGEQSLGDLLADPDPLWHLLFSQDVVVVGAPLEGPGRFR